MKFPVPRSLFGRLLLGLAGVTLLIWIGVLVLSIYDTHTELKRATERDAKVWTEQALIVAGALADRPQRIPYVIGKSLHVRAAALEQHGFHAQVVKVYIWRGNSLLFSTEHDAPPFPPPVQPGAYSHSLPSEGLWAGWIAADPLTGITIASVHEVVGPYFLTISSIAYYLLPLLYSLPFMLIPAFFVIKVSLRPLGKIVSDIEQRSASDLSPLPPSPYKELSPLVGSVNRLMNRLTEQVSIEQAFLLDAAHELKTPLSVIQANAEGLLNDLPPEEAKQANEGLRQGVARATHTVHQLLALARSGATRRNEESQMLNLVSLVRDRLALAANVALRRSIEIELQSPEICMLPIHRESAASLIDNLVDNAVKYSPNKSTVTVSIEEDADKVILTVSDEGPGIPRALRNKVFERFYRIPGQDQEGSGLGLAIAESAATRNHANLRLEDGPHGNGLSAIVEFRIDPTQQHGPADEKETA